MSDATILAEYIRDLESRLSRLERQDKVTPGGGGGGVGFSDGEGDPALVGTTADGTSTYAARRDHVHALAAADVLAKLLTVDGTASLLDADKLDGQEGAYYLPSGSYTAADVLTKIKTVDGTGSGLDADTVDGVHAAALGAPSAADILAALSTVDGASSGLDADLLDGSHASAFAASSHAHSDKLDVTAYTAADVLTKIKTVDGAGSGLDADLLDGQSSAYYLAASTYTAADVLAKLLTVDGATSGLDADYLDGLSSIYFLPASYYTAADVFSKVTGLDGPGSGLNADFVDGYEASDFARVAASNTFAANQTINGTLTLPATNATSMVQVASADLGTGSGGMLYIGRNTNASTPAPGAIVCGKVNAAGNAYLWPDDSGNWRTILNTVITSANRNGGTVVGAQTSALDAKDLVGEVASIEDVLKAVQKGAKAVRRFKYKAQNTDSRDAETKRNRSRPFNGEAFEGVVIDFAPRYGMDEDETHPAGKSLNMVTAIGDLLRAVAWLVEREQARGNA